MGALDGKMRKDKWKLDKRPPYGAKYEFTTHVPAPSPSLRIRAPGPPVEERLWRLRARDPGTDTLAPIRLPGDNREPGRAIGMLLVVDERGRVEDEASFGSTELFLRVPEFGAPEARFLKDKSPNHNQKPGGYVQRDMAHRFLITSVFRDSGLTTPCNFCGSVDTS